MPCKDLSLIPNWGYYQILDQLNMIIEQDDELLQAIGVAIKLREDVTEDRIEDLLAEATTLSAMADIRQYLFVQESRKVQAAADMLRQG